MGSENNNKKKKRNKKKRGLVFRFRRIFRVVWQTQRAGIQSQRQTSKVCEEQGAGRLSEGTNTSTVAFKFYGFHCCRFRKDTLYWAGVSFLSSSFSLVCRFLHFLGWFSGKDTPSSAWISFCRISFCHRNRSFVGNISFLTWEFSFFHCSLRMVPACSVAAPIREHRRSTVLNHKL